MATLTLFIGLACAGLQKAPDPPPPVQSEPPVGTKQIVDMPPPVAQPSTAPTEPYLTDLGCWGKDWNNAGFGPIPLHHHHVLNTVCAVLYVKDSNGQLVWTRQIPAPVFDTPKVIGNEVVILSDLDVFGLDPETGDEHWHYNGHDKIVFTKLERFRGDMYLLYVDMSMYENEFEQCVLADPNQWDDCPRTQPDEVWLFRKDELLRQFPVPANSTLKVIGGKAFATYSHRGRMKKVQIVH